MRHLMKKNIIASLKQSIVWDKQQMITLQKEIEMEERLLNLFEGKRINHTGIGL